MTRVNVIVVIQQLQTKLSFYPPRSRGACTKGSQEFERSHGNRYYYSLKLLIKLCDQFTDSLIDSQ